MCKMWTGVCVCKYVCTMCVFCMKETCEWGSFVFPSYAEFIQVYVYIIFMRTLKQRTVSGLSARVWLYRTDSQTHTNKQHYRDCLRRRRRRAFKRKIGDASVHATLLARQQFRVNCSRSRLVHKTRDKTQAALLRSTNTDDALHTSAPHMQTPLHTRAGTRASCLHTRNSERIQTPARSYTYIYTHTHKHRHTHT